MLNKAEALVSLQRNPTDYLNYSYYKALYLLKINDLAAAEDVIKHLREKAAGNTKFKWAAMYLQARWLLQKGDAKVSIFAGSKRDKIDYTSLTTNFPDKLPKCFALNFAIKAFNMAKSEDFRQRIPIF